MASIDRTAYPRYRRTPTRTDLEHHYTLRDDERSWLQAVVRSDSGMLCCALLLKAVQHLGYFPPLTSVPETILHHLRIALALPTTITAFGVSTRTVATYQQRIRVRLNLITTAARFAIRLLRPCSVRPRPMTRQPT